MKNTVVQENGIFKTSGIINNNGTTAPFKTDVRNYKILYSIETSNHVKQIEVSFC